MFHLESPSTCIFGTERSLISYTDIIISDYRDCSMVVAGRMAKWSPVIKLRKMQNFSVIIFSKFSVQPYQNLI